MALCRNRPNPKGMKSNLCLHIFFNIEITHNSKFKSHIVYEKQTTLEELAH